LIKLATTGREVRELTFGIHADKDANPWDYELVGCGAPGLSAMDPCVDTDPNKNLFPWINASMSFTGAGPGVNPNTERVFWMTLRGNTKSADPDLNDSDVLFPVLDTETTERIVSLGVLLVPGPVANPNTPPTLFQDPTEAEFMAPLFPVTTTDLVDPEHPIRTDRNLTHQAANNSDSDGDGISEDTDNCRYAWNGFDPSFPLLVQRDTGGLAMPGDLQRPDGRGDVCQCGEGDGTGEITASDVMALRHVLARSHVTGIDEDERGRCSVAINDESGDNQSCNIKDLADLDRAVESGSFPSGNPNVCRRAVVQNLTPDG
jgi:hypothetical protein